MDQNLSGIDRRKEVLPEKWHEDERRHGTSQKSCDKQLRTPQNAREKFVVLVTALLKPMLEAELETLQRISRWSGRTSSAVDQMRPQQVLGQRRDQGAGQQERPDEGKNDGFRQRPEQIAGHAAKLEHRCEHDADADQRNEGRNDDLLGAIQDSRFKRLALLQMPVDVLERNSALVDQDPNRKREPPERHHIDRFAQPRQRSE